MSDFRETKEATERDLPRQAEAAQLGPQGTLSMQGKAESQRVQDSSQPDSGDDLATIHPGRGIEFEPTPETEPRTIENPFGQQEDSENKIKPPAEWQPGGAERKG